MEANTTILIAEKNRLNDASLLLLCLFTCALLIHLGSSYWIHRKTTAFIFIMVGLQFLNHRLWWTTLLAAGAFIFNFAGDFPRLANHANIELVLAILLLLFFALRIMGVGLKLVNLTLSFRILAVSLYVIAGFHKLNSGFFETPGSCGSHINRFLNPLLFGEDYLASELMITLSQYATIVLEMVVPLGLLHFRTRKPTIIILASFHFYLSICGFTNFSSFAGFLLIAAFFEPSKHRSLVPVLLPFLKAYQFFALATAFATFMLPKILSHDFLNSRIGFIAGCIYNIGWVFLFFGFMKLIPTVKDRSNPHWLPVVVFTAITFWGMQGYLGLSSAGNLSMFSNLITEQSRNNHFLIDTRKTKLWHFEEDYVTILEIPDHCRWGGSQILKNYDLPMTEFRIQAADWVQKHRKIKCKLRYKGKTLYISDLAKSDFSKPDWWERFLVYRKIPQKGQNECLW